MNVSHMQVPDEDDHHDEQSLSNTIKANNKIVGRANLREKQSRANKIVTEQVWINPVTSKSQHGAAYVSEGEHCQEQVSISCYAYATTC